MNISNLLRMKREKILDEEINFMVIEAFIESDSKKINSRSRLILVKFNKVYQSRWPH